MAEAFTRPAQHRSRRRTAAAALGLLALSGFALSACASGGGVSGGGGNVNYVAADDPGMSTVPAGDRQSAPQISGTTLTGQKLALSQYQGHIVVLNVWGSWCTPCREEGPALEGAYQQYRSKGVDFLGINTRDDNAAALAYVSNTGITYPSLQDPDETLVLQFKAIFPATTVPSTVILDQQGKVAVRVLGQVTEPELDQELNALLAAKQS
jgi:thiol-disulfide isomerase/thioredoxin